MLYSTFEPEELEEFVIPVVPIITIVIDTIIVSTSFLLIKNTKNDNSLYKETISIINIFIVSDLCTIITSKITSGIVKSYTTMQEFKILTLINTISYTELLFKYSKFLLAIAAAISIGKKIMIKHDNN